MDQIQQSANPLAKHFRQPAIYLTLPSNGKFWAEGSIIMPANGELPVLPMSTRDEIILRTPDALMNGQGIVNVIQSCFPSIVDAWKMPSIDVDACIIAIRVASYGNQMDFDSTCPHCNERNEYAISLGAVLANISAPDYSKPLAASGLTIKLKPQEYVAVNRNNLIAFEEQQIMRTIATADGDDIEAIQTQFDLHLNKLIDLNVETLVSSTESITTEDGTVVRNPDHLREFYKNCETRVIKDVQAQLKEHTDVTALKPVTVNCLDCNEEFDVKIEFDWTRFFGTGS